MNLGMWASAAPRRGPDGRQGPGDPQGEMTMPIPQVNDRIKEAPAVMLRAVFAGVGQLLLAADKVRSRAAESGWPAVPKSPSRGHSRWHSLDESRGGSVPLPRDKAAVRQPPAPGDAAASDSRVTQNQTPATGSFPQASAAESLPRARTVPARSVPMRRPGEPTPLTKPAGKAKQAAKTGSAAKAKAAGKTKTTAKAEPDSKAKTAGKAEPAIKAVPAAKPESAAKAEPVGKTGNSGKAKPTAKARTDGRTKAAAKAEPAKPKSDVPPLPGYDELTLPSLRARMRGFDVATLRAVLEYEKAHAHRGDVITMFERRLAKVTAE